VQIVDALPLTATGKVHKDVLRDEVAGLPGRDTK
jgi:acyl-coenzyme A synthetase/AMP-(fatty) acid ligase